ncbi:MAG: AAA family ATPase, partial [Patescibacteria group bacterium]|nr:AAA family ATPase [Patescibacteria group bacterium]
IVLSGLLDETEMTNVSFSTVEDIDGEEDIFDFSTETETVLKQKKKKKKKTDEKTLEELEVEKQLKIYASYYKNIRWLIIDEIGVVDLVLLSLLFAQLPYLNLKKIILVGDHDQILSICTGNVLYDFIQVCERRGVSIVKLEKNYRFDQSASVTTQSSLFTNLDLIYRRSKNISSQWRVDEQSSISTFQSSEDLVQQIETLYEKHGVSHTQIYTYERDNREAIIRSVRSTPNYRQTFCMKEDTSYIVPQFEIGPHFMPGERIAIEANNNPFTIQLYVIPPSFFEKEHVPSGSTFKNFQQMFKSCNVEHIVSSARKKTIRVPYVSNGMLVTVESVYFGFTRGETSGAILEYYVIYQLHGHKYPLVIGEGAIPPTTLKHGIATTIHKIQGCEKKHTICVLYHAERNYMDYRIFLVGASRARTGITYLFEAPHFKNMNTKDKLDAIRNYTPLSHIQQVVSRDSEPRRSLLWRRIFSVVYGT